MHADDLGECCLGREFERAPRPRRREIPRRPLTRGQDRAAVLKTASDACRGSKQEVLLKPGRSSRSCLFASRAGVHVNFHAHLHLDNLRSFPGHCVSQALLRRDVHAGVKGKAAPDITQEFHINVVRCSGLQRYFLSSWNNRFDKYRMRFDGGPEDQSADRFRAVNRKRSIYELSQQSQERLSSAGI